MKISEGSWKLFHLNFLLNGLFRDVYANGTDETRKAMNKSFTESGGTTLSTNWSDVGAKKLDVKPPDGMEWKKY